MRNSRSKLKINSNSKKHSINQSPFFKLKTKKKLIELLGLASSELSIAKKDIGNYVVFEQMGNNGKSRTIQHPKDKQNEIHNRIANLLTRIELPAYLHSGRKKHSHITNATQHLGSKKVLTTDIKSFFQSTTKKMVFNFFNRKLLCSPDVSHILSCICTFNGHIPTGSQLSMPLAFWANIDMFERLENLSSSLNVDMTVYVDDLTFSGEQVNRRFLSLIKKIIISSGQVPHPLKTKLFKKNDLKIITGVALKEDKTLITNKQHMLIYQSFESWKGCRDEPVIANYVMPKLLGRLNALSGIDPKLKDKAKSLINYKPTSLL
ncbi:RNA-directed DNA polymerase [Pseudoalteromonas sp. NEC-BIFX-2020_002]|uniref:reverse transcriptase family protein n=1 Tax=Pseudoalteromonas sp. NEC-BIFX-2020_002 TaxID=2732353 RepID=UPI001476E5A4|nr:reverse transcriptase family protein [Pseudoalteromonas sp. NEC-BIFX-2020_002]NNG42413.1 RNA-directed DNA polymerase [Pseudoalteromonas sp. NEC-BIFX-2020_002]